MITLVLGRLSTRCLHWFFPLKCNRIGCDSLLDYFFLNRLFQTFLLQRLFPWWSLSRSRSNLFFLLFTLKWFHIFLSLRPLTFSQSQLLPIHFLLLLKIILNLLLPCEVSTLIELSAEALIRVVFDRVFLIGEKGVVMWKGVLLQLGQSDAFSLDLSFNVLELADGFRVGEVELPIEVGRHPLLGSGGRTGWRWGGLRVGSGRSSWHVAVRGLGLRVLRLYIGVLRHCLIILLIGFATYGAREEGRQGIEGCIGS